MTIPTIDGRPDKRLFLVLAGIALLPLILHILAIQEYGVFRDELYYLASTRHLDLGYVEHPPLSIYVLAVQTAIFGDSLIAIRALPLITGIGVVVMTALLVKEIGGSLPAQALAALAVALLPIYLGTQHIYSMNAIDELLWALAAFVFARLLRTGNVRLWLLLGLLLGLGLMNKISVLWLIAGIGVGLVLTTHRSWLRTWWPWIAGAIAAVMFLPYVVWQFAHDFPALEFMRNATQRKMVSVGPGGFIMGQVLGMNPIVFPMLIAGALGLIFMKSLRPWRILGLVFLTVVVILMSSGTSKDYYLAGAYPFLLAPGAITMTVLFSRKGWHWAGYTYAALIVVTGVLLSPFALPLLPEETYIAYARSLGISQAPQERQRTSELPQYYADMHGWQEMADSVARVYHSLPASEQKVCSIFGHNYGEAGAIDVLGRKLGLPPAMSGHNSYWLWGPRGNGEVIIVVGGDSAGHAAVFESVEQASMTNAKYAMPYENGRPIFVCRKIKLSIADIWSRTKDYI